MYRTARNASYTAILILWQLTNATSYAVESISGRVVDSRNSMPVAGADIDVFDETDSFVPLVGGTTDAQGLYSVTLPGPGNYTIRVDATLSSGLVDQYFDHTFLRSQADIISVAANQAVSGIDFDLVPGATMLGRVFVASTGNGIGGIDIDLFAGNGEFLSGYSATTAPDGTFALGVLPPGDFFVRADPDPALGQFFVRTYFGGQLSLNEASVITLGDQNISGLDIMLLEGGTISGNLSDTDSGAPLADIDIDVFDADGNRSPADARSDAAGNYTVGAVLPGFYVVRADPTIPQGYPRTYHPDVLLESSATVIQVVAGTDTPLADIVLTRGGTIAGQTLSAEDGSVLSNIDIDVFFQDGQRVSADATSNELGVFEIGPLAPGDYIIRADPALAQGLVRTYFPDTIREEEAMLVSVLPGVQTTGVDFMLSVGGTIAGQVTDQQSGNPVPLLDIDVFDAMGIRSELSATTDDQGNYEIGALPPGDYAVRVDPAVDQVYPRTYFDGVYFRENARPVAVLAGSRTGSIDFGLVRGGTISGAITFAQGGDVAADVDLDCFDETGQRLEVSARSDVDGNYRIGPLLPGRYFLRADPTSPYAEQFYEGQIDVALADPIEVAAEADSQPFDFALVLGGRISGSLTDANNQALADIDLDLYDAATQTVLRKNAASGPDGTYAFEDLMPGDYLVRADPDPSQGFVREYYNDRPTRALADVVSVVSGADRVGTDFQLETAGSVSGTVVDRASGQPVPGIDIDVLRAVDLFRFEQGATTASDGSFVVSSLPPGDYFVRADPSTGTGFARTYYDSAMGPSEALIVTVSSGATTRNIDIALLSDGSSMPPARCGAAWTSGYVDRGSLADVTVLACALVFLLRSNRHRKPFGIG